MEKIITEKLNFKSKAVTALTFLHLYHQIALSHCTDRWGPYKHEVTGSDLCLQIDDPLQLMFGSLMIPDWVQKSGRHSIGKKSCYVGQQAVSDWSALITLFSAVGNKTLLLCNPAVLFLTSSAWVKMPHQSLHQFMFCLEQIKLIEELHRI